MDVVVVVGQAGGASGYAALPAPTRAAVTFVATLLVAGIVVNALPNRTARAADIATDQPLRTLLFGGACLLLSVGTTVLLLRVPLVNLLLALLLLVFVAATSAFGAAVTGAFLVGGSWSRCIAVGAGVAAVLAVLPGAAGAAQLLVNAVGAGALFREARTSG